MLLIIEALLLILAALEQDHRAAAVEKKFPLDMAPNSVDDQYENCKETYKHLEGLGKEMFLNEFNLDYQEAEKNAKKPEDGLKKIHSIAIYAYTNNDSNVFTTFNNAVRSEKQKYKEGAFKWFSLQFLLTNVIHILKKTQNKCYSTYRGTKVNFDTDVLNKEVRLGSFSSSSLNRKVAEEFGTKSCFEIHTCEGADIIKYSKHPEQEEVLIPPYETFKVVDVKKRANQKGLWCDTVYKLEKTGQKSYLNCRADK